MAKAKRLQMYSAYVFKQTEKDPIIDKIHTVLDQEGASYHSASQKSGVSASCIYNWIEGETRRPQYCTIAAVMGAFDYEMVWQKKANGGGNHTIRKRRVG